MTDSSVPSDEDIGLFLGNVDDPNFGNVEFEAPPPEPEPVKVDDNIESGFEEATVPVGDGECIVCGAPTFRPPGLTPTGRKKRAPRHCDLHNPKRRVSKEGPFTSGVESQLQRIQEELADDLRLLGVMAGPLFPVTGFYVFQNADPFTTAILKLCKNNQRALRVLHRAASVAPIYEVLKDGAGVFYAVQVDTGKQDPHNMVSQRLGVERAYDAVYPSSETVNNVSNNGAPGPPKYATAV